VLLAQLCVFGYGTRDQRNRNRADASAGTFYALTTSTKVPDLAPPQRASVSTFLKPDLQIQRRHKTVEHSVVMANLFPTALDLVRIKRQPLPNDPHFTSKSMRPSGGRNILALVVHPPQPFQARHVAL